MIHNHEVPGSIPGPATAERHSGDFLLNAFLFLFFYLQEMQNIVAAVRDEVGMVRFEFSAWPEPPTDTDGGYPGVSSCLHIYTGVADVDRGGFIHICHADDLLDDLWVGFYRIQR